MANIILNKTSFEVNKSVYFSIVVYETKDIFLKLGKFLLSSGTIFKEN
jgi:hypothetical protein